MHTAAGLLLSDRGPTTDARERVPGMGVRYILTGRAKTSARRERFDSPARVAPGLSRPLHQSVLPFIPCVPQSDGHERLKPVRLIPYQAAFADYGAPGRWAEEHHRVGRDVGFAESGFRPTNRDPNTVGTDLTRAGGRRRLGTA
jgi:hypothetical protein